MSPALKLFVLREQDVPGKYNIRIGDKLISLFNKLGQFSSLSLIVL
jgi:hypothetical protein